jgi:hypothetical protein
MEVITYASNSSKRNLITYICTAQKDHIQRKFSINLTIVPIKENLNNVLYFQSTVVKWKYIVHSCVTNCTSITFIYNNGSKEVKTPSLEEITRTYPRRNRSIENRRQPLPES